MLFVICIICFSFVMCDIPKAYIPGDIGLGVILPLYNELSNNITLNRCKTINEIGIRKVESIIQTLSTINEDPTFFPGIKLGLIIADFCWFKPILYNEWLYMKSANNATLEMLNEKLNEENHICPKIGHFEALIDVLSINISNNFTPLFPYFSNILEAKEKCYILKEINEQRKRNFDPDISIDEHQVDAMVELAKYFEWSYFPIIYTAGSKSYKALKYLENISAKHNICLSTQLEIGTYNKNEIKEKILKLHKSNKNSNVIYCICSQDTLRNILKVMDDYNITSDYIFVTSDFGYRDGMFSFERIATPGSLSITISRRVKEFEDHFSSLTPENNFHNPWFKDYWQQKFNCSLKENSSNPCKGDEKLDGPFEEEDEGFYYSRRAIYDNAKAIKRMQNILCPNISGICDKMKPFNWDYFRKYYRHNYMWEENKFEFVHPQNELLQYDIINYQEYTNGTNVFRKVGTWGAGKLNIFDKNIQWPKNLQPSSFCSEECPAGLIRIRVKPQCCWVCGGCQENEFLLDKYTCEPCLIGYSSNYNKTGCNETMYEYIKWGGGINFVISTISFIGVIVAISIFILFVRYKNTSIIKSTSRELNYIILLGIMVCHITSFVIQGHPTYIQCYLGRLLPAIGLTLIYAPLVARIRSIENNLRKLTLVSIKSQLLIVLMLFSIQCCIICLLIAYEPIQIHYDFNYFGRAIVMCKESSFIVFLPISYIFFLIISCLIYAFKSRNFPEHYNEAKFIVYTAYITIILWLAFAFIYFFSSIHPNIVICITLNLCALIVSSLVFSPKLYVVLYEQ